MSKSNTKTIRLTDSRPNDVSSAPKLFPADKNYILKEVQGRTEKEMLNWLVEYVKEYYETIHNPLGLVDSTIMRIRSSSFKKIDLLHEFYNVISGIYRFKHGETQLEFLFDGSNHYTKYKSEWKVTFMKWITQLLHQPVVMHAFLEITVFGTSTERQLELALGRLKTYSMQHFKIKIYKYRGIQEVQVA